MTNQENRISLHEGRCGSCFVIFSPNIWVQTEKFIFLQHKQQIFAMSTQAMTQTIAEYFKTQPVLKAWLFGSYSRGEEKPDSDVDILVALDYSKPIGLRFFGMWGDLERMLGKKIDLVTEGSLMPFAQSSANRYKILIYERTA